MANLGYGLETTRHGHTALETKRNKAMTAYTTTNLVDLEKCPVCSLHILEGECMCSLIEAPYVASETHPGPVVTNKKGEPYSVAWQSHKIAHVFHPGDLEYYKVVMDIMENVTCYNRSDYDCVTGQGKCWPFADKKTCVHCDALLNSIELGERPESTYSTPKKPTQKPASPVVEAVAGGNTVMHLGTALEAIFGYENEPPVRRERVKEKW